MTIGDRIRNRRKQLRMSVDELATRLGKDRSTIYRYENGDIENLPLDLLVPIARALDTTQQALMGWDDDEKTESLSKEKLELIEQIKALPEEKVQLLLQLAKSLR